MLDQAFGRSFAFVLSAVSAVLFTASAADAALKKYELGIVTLSQFSQASPRAEMIGNQVTGVGLIDESGASPILRKLVYGDDPNGPPGGITIEVPEIGSGFIWLSGRDLQGPSNNQVGTGATASSINWGNTDGWTITGAEFCHSVPAVICSFADREDLVTGDPPFISTNYDTGTWVFHGTGFVMPDGYITFTNTAGGEGNAYTRLKGRVDTDGTVPALPLLGIGAVGVSVIAMGIASMRRR